MGWKDDILDKDVDTLAKILCRIVGDNVNASGDHATVNGEKPRNWHLYRGQARYMLEEGADANEALERKYYDSRVRDPKYYF